MAAQRQNPAYRPAKERPRSGGAFLFFVWGGSAFAMPSAPGPAAADSQPGAFGAADEGGRHESRRRRRVQRAVDEARAHPVPVGWRSRAGRSRASRSRPRVCAASSSTLRTAGPGGEPAVHQHPVWLGREHLARAAQRDAPVDAARGTALTPSTSQSDERGETARRVRRRRMKSGSRRARQSSAPPQRLPGATAGGHRLLDVCRLRARPAASAAIESIDSSMWNHRQLATAAS